MRRKLAVLLVLPMLLAAGGARAAYDPAWPGMLSASVAAVKAGHYQAALEGDEVLIQQLIEQLGPGEEPTKFFAAVMGNKSVALAGLGREEESLLYWDLAKALWPGVAQIDVGAPGALLVEQDPFLGAPHVGGEVKAPAVLKRVDPVYAEGARKSRTSGMVILACRVNRDGSVRHVHLLRSLPAPTLAYTALEAVRQWRFLPATQEGQPVDVTFNLTINFKLTADEEAKP